MKAATCPVGLWQRLAQNWHWMLIAHILVWITLPSLMEGSIRLDVSEGAIGGREWQLAYQRHPPFTTWLIEIARWTGPFRYIAVYVFGQILAMTGLLLVGATARRLEKNQPGDGQTAFVLTLALGLVSPVLTYIPIQLNHNIGLMLFSGAMIYAAHRAFEDGGTRNWLLFGISLGLGLWAKYAILLLAAPLGIAFLLVPAWRAQLRTPGPWIGILVAVLLITPHAFAVVSGGGSTITFATRTLSQGWVTNIGFAASFLLNAALFMLPMALVAIWMNGNWQDVRQRISASFSPATITRNDIFRHTITFGPVLVTALAALLTGVKPRFLWLTPMVPAFALWWSHAALPVGDKHKTDRGATALAAIALILIASYITIRLASPHTNRKTLYPDFDGPLLAQMADKYWQERQNAPLGYIVTFGQQLGRQAGGSIAFDLPSTRIRPIHVFEDANLRASPWIHMDDLQKRGALIVSPLPLSNEMKIQGLPITDIEARPRPLVRGATNPNAKIWFGILQPAH